MKKTATVWIMNKKTGEFLLQLRGPNMKKNPNTWRNSASGQIKKGEKPITAIQRETFEELGIDIPEKDFILLDDFKTVKENGKKKHTWVFYTEGYWELSDIKIQKSEVTAVRYALFDEIKKLAGTIACSIKKKNLRILKKHLKNVGNNK